MKKHIKRKSFESGAAIITAMLIVVLAVSIVSGLLWQNQLQIQRITNERLKSQAVWLLYGGVDWARLILREDAKSSVNNVDYLGEVWSVPIEKTRLSDFIKQYESKKQGKADSNKQRDQSASNARNILDDDNETLFSGKIEDAQSRFNLRNLVTFELKNINGRTTSVAVLNKPALEIVKSILANSQISDKELANQLANHCLQLEQSQFKQINSPTNTPNNSETNNIPVESIDEIFIQIPQFKLKESDYKTLNRLFTWLPSLDIPLNINTAGPDVLIGVFQNASKNQINQLIELRNQQHFKDPEFNDLAVHMRNLNLKFSPEIERNKKKMLSIGSEYFELYGQIDNQEATVATKVLIQRKNNEFGQIFTQVISSIPSDSIY